MVGLVSDNSQHSVPSGAVVAASSDINVVGRVVLTPGDDCFFPRLMAAAFATVSSQLCDNASLVIHFTSAMPGEGVSTVAREFAFLAGQANWCSTLLLDGRSSGGGQASWFRLPSLPDIGQSLQTAATMDVVHVQCGNGAYSLASLAEGGVNDPMVVRHCYRRLRETFRLTIVDCSPVMTSPDTAALSRFADGVILVIEAEKTKIPVIVRSREEIESADGVVRGVILNKRRQYIPDAIYKFL